MSSCTAENILIQIEDDAARPLTFSQCKDTQRQSHRALICPHINVWMVVNWGLVVFFPPADHPRNAKKQITHHIVVNDRAAHLSSPQKLQRLLNRGCTFCPLFFRTSAKQGGRSVTYRVCLFICRQFVSCWPLCRESNHSHSASLCFCSHAHNPLRR